MNFNKLGLKELIATGYRINNTDTPYILDIQDTTQYLNAQTDLDSTGVEWLLKTKINELKPLANNEESSFRNTLDLLDKCDIVVTNPPFSLFREFITLLISHNKKFLVIGHQNAITYKEIFPLIKENKIWLGYGFKNNVGFFKSPYEDTANSSQHIQDKIRISGVVWFTNMDHEKRHELIPLNLQCTYRNNEDMYPKYDNYNAINVDKTTQIPNDYHGIMGVPITFLQSFCPEQFEIIGLSSKHNKGSVEQLHDNDYYNGYTRGKVVTKIESNMPLLRKSKKGTICRKDGYPNLYQLYWRIFIKFTDDYINKTNTKLFVKNN